MFIRTLNRIFRLKERMKIELTSVKSVFKRINLQKISMSLVKITSFNEFNIFIDYRAINMQLR